MRLAAWSLLALLTAAGAPSFAAERDDPAAVAAAFHRALAAGDEKTALGLLAPEALIYENGAVEHSAAEYAASHLRADIAFSRQVRREKRAQRSGGEGGTAWIATRSRMHGRVNDRDVDLDANETLVLTLTPAGWRIAHIHWSSAPRRK